MRVSLRRGWNTQSAQGVLAIEFHSFLGRVRISSTEGLCDRHVQLPAHCDITWNRRGRIHRCLQKLQQRLQYCYHEAVSSDLHQTEMKCLVSTQALLAGDFRIVNTSGHRREFGKFIVAGMQGRLSSGITFQNTPKLRELDQFMTGNLQR